VPSDLSDSALMSAHVAGDPDAFAELFRRHRDRLWAVALRTTSDPEEAADALQDAMISAFRGASSYRGEAAVTTWLHRVVVNACLDRMRRHRARPTVPLPGADPERGQDTLADPRDAIASSELAVELGRALATLPAEQRAAIVLVDVQGYRVDEAAGILEIPAGTVKSRCARGRAKLALQLADYRPRNPQPHLSVTPPATASDPPDAPDTRTAPDTRAPGGENTT
jgi:RNA polymerase sigma-70 factor (ECF subfamily)